jgi:RNase adaptor protein for sRNA GlmZ degradation
MSDCSVKMFSLKFEYRTSLESEFVLSWCFFSFFFFSYDLDELHGSDREILSKVLALDEGVDHLVEFLQYCLCLFGCD